MRGVAVRGWRAVLAVITCVAITMSGLISVSTPTPAHAASGINVFFDANGGSFTGGLSRKSVSSDATGVVTASQISGVGEPSNTGYTFDGWYSTAQGGEKLNTSEGLIVEYSQSWYAHWKRTSTTPTPTPTPTGNVSVTIQTGGAPFGSYVFPGNSVIHPLPLWDARSWNWNTGSWNPGEDGYGGKMLSAPSTGLNSLKTQATLTVTNSDDYKLDLLPYTPLNTSAYFVSDFVSGETIQRIYRDFQEDVLFWVARASGEWDWTVLAPIGGSGTTVDLSAYAGRSVTLQPVTRRAVRTGSGIVDKTNPLLSVVLNPDGGSWPDGSTGNKSVEGPVFASTATGASQNTALTPQAGSLDQKYLRGGASAPSKNGLPLYDWSGDVWSGSATLTARYGYRVTLNGNGGTFPDGSTTKTTTSANIVEPTRSGYTLIGWIGSDGRTYPTGSTVPVSSDTTLYAQWRAMYSTVFDANGGAFYNGDRSRTLYSVSASVSADDLDAWLKKPVHALNASGQHVVFTKWTSNPDGSGTVLDTSQVLNVVTPRTWYAQYRQSDLKITLDAGSGKFATTYPRQGVTVASDPSQYDIYASASGVVDGSRFASIPEAFRKNPSNANEMQVAARWNTKSDGSGVDLPASGDMQITRNVTFYPVWERAYSLTLLSQNFGVSLDFGNVPGKTNDYTAVLYGKKGDLLDISPYRQDLTMRAAGQSLIGLGGLTAHFLDSFVNFVAGEQGAAFKEGTYGESFRLSPNTSLTPNEEGYLNHTLGALYGGFPASPLPLHPSTDVEPGHPLINFYIPPILLGDVTDFNTHSEPCRSPTPNITDTYFYCSTMLDLNGISFTVPGKHFIGWATRSQPTSSTSQEWLETWGFTGILSNYSKEHYIGPNTVTVNHAAWLMDTDLFAWFGFMLHLDANGGVFSDGSTSRSVASNGDGVVDAASVNNAYGVGSSGVPTRAGYTFMGWSTNARWKPGDGSTGDFPSAGSLTLGSDTTYYAKWKRNPVLTLNANGGSFDGLSLVRVSSDSHGRILSTALAGFVPTRTHARLKADPAWNTVRHPSSSTPGLSRSTSSDVTLSSDVTWYAQWDLDQFDATFNADPSRTSVGEASSIRSASVYHVSSPADASSSARWQSNGTQRLSAAEDGDHPFTSGMADASNVPYGVTSPRLGGTYAGSLIDNMTRPSTPVSGVDADERNAGSQRVFSFVGWSQSRQDLTQNTPVIPPLVPLPTDSTGTMWYAAPGDPMGGTSPGTQLYGAYRYTRFNLMDGKQYPMNSATSFGELAQYQASIDDPDTSDLTSPSAGGQLFPRAHRYGFMFMGWARTAARARSGEVDCAPYDDAAFGRHQCRVDADHAGTYYAVWKPMKVRVNYADKAVRIGQAPSGCNKLATPTSDLYEFDPSLQGFTVRVTAGASGLSGYGCSVTDPLNVAFVSQNLYLTGWADYGVNGPVRPDYTVNRLGQYMATKDTNLLRSVSVEQVRAVGSAGVPLFVAFGGPPNITPTDSRFYQVASADHPNPDSLPLEETLYALWGTRVRSLPSAGGPASLIALVVGIILTLLLIGVSIVRRTMPVYSHTSHGKHAL